MSITYEEQEALENMSVNDLIDAMGIDGEELESIPVFTIEELTQ